MPDGWDEARPRVERFVDQGITGFVEHLVPLEARLSGSPAPG
ncbi:MAG: hypothetical protein K0S40_1446 [Actinomycetospora sp.]|jgi:hypothetical protein|nr:hypothetical protein [Actinomycetospora sp.]